MSVRVEVAGRVGRIALDRADRLNALDETTRLALVDALGALGADPAVSVLTLTGIGRAFCVGQDLAATGELVDAAATVRDTYNPVVRAITGLDKPVIARVNGPAVGAGMGLALACDVVVMSADAFMSCAFSQVALVPDTGCSVALLRAVGYQRAFEIAASARRIPAAEALSLGLATEAVVADELDLAVQRQAERLAEGSAHALALTKRILRGVDAEALADSLEQEAASQGVAARHPDHAEGRRAFSERRRPVFGR